MIPYGFDYHPKFLEECKKLFKRCPEFDNDFKRFKKVINSDLEIFEHRLPKKYIPVKKHGFNIKLPLFKYRNFYCKKGNGNKLRFIFLLHRSESLVIFTEVYHKNNKDDLDYKRVEAMFK